MEVVKQANGNEDKIHYDDDVDVEMSNTDPTYTGSADNDDIDIDQVYASPVENINMEQHHPLPETNGVYPIAAGPVRPAAVAEGVSWGPAVRQIDRSGQILECDSETVVSGLTMPTWSAQRPWEAPIIDAPYGPSYLNRQSLSNRFVDLDSDGNEPVKTHRSCFDKSRSRKLFIPFLFLGLAAIGAVVGLMFFNQDTSNTSTGNTPALDNDNPGSVVVVDNNTVRPTMSPTRRIGGGIIVTSNLHPSDMLTPSPTMPTPSPTASPTKIPTASPTTVAPTLRPSPIPTVTPGNPTMKPTTATPTALPTISPTKEPTISPTASPTDFPTSSPTYSPTVDPTQKPTNSPTETSTENPTPSPTLDPTIEPTNQPTNQPTDAPEDPQNDDTLPTLCTICTDIRSPWMAKNGNLFCENWVAAYRSRCRQDEEWVENRYCRYSCFVNGAGYDGDECCVQAPRGNDDSDDEVVDFDTPSPTVTPSSSDFEGDDDFVLGTPIGHDGTI